MEVWKIFSIPNGRFVSICKFQPLISLPGYILNPDSLGSFLQTFHTAVGAKGSARVVSELEWTFFMCHTSCLVESCKNVGWVQVEWGGIEPWSEWKGKHLGIGFQQLCVCVCLLGFRSSSKLATSSFFCWYTPSFETNSVGLF